MLNGSWCLAGKGQTLSQRPNIETLAEAESKLERSWGLHEDVIPTS